MSDMMLCFLLSVVTFFQGVSVLIFVINKLTIYKIIIIISNGSSGSVHARLCTDIPAIKVLWQKLPGVMIAKLIKE